MDRAKKTLDAAKMVRRIRDRHYERTKDMTKEERLNFYHDKGAEAQERLQRLARGKSDAGVS
jgi:hypothetical protein